MYRCCINKAVWVAVPTGLYIHIQNFICQNLSKFLKLFVKTTTNCIYNNTYNFVCMYVWAERGCFVCVCSSGHLIDPNHLPHSHIHTHTHMRILSEILHWSFQPLKLYAINNIYFSFLGSLSIFCSFKNQDAASTTTTMILLIFSTK